MKAVKKILLRCVNVISILLIVFSVTVLLTVIFTPKGQTPNIFGYSVFRVMTGSMEPTIPTGSLIVTQKVEASRLQVGDIISFVSKDPSIKGEINTHRIVAVEQSATGFNFTTKGDANHVNDKTLTYDTDVVGKVVYISLLMGKIVRLASNPLIFVPFIIVPLLVLILCNFIDSVKMVQKIAKEEQEAAVREMVQEIRRKQSEEDGVRESTEK